MQLATTVNTATAGRTDRLGDTVDLAARIALAFIFAWSGADKLFMHTAGTVQYMQAAGLPLASLLVYPAGLLELGGGLLIVFGYRARAAALLLAGFTAVATLIFHAFWAAPADQAMLQSLMFFKNLAILGGLLHVVAHGSGRFALDR
ncbi:MAG TPA: DoxX family protein [Burkholderiales bacterium]|nr:DoxX family protein [Burkholderiales bacterium]